MKTCGNFNFIETELKDVFIIEPKVFGDERGFFLETYNETAFKEFGLDLRFVQDNHSKSQKGVLRGFHFQKKHPQGKLIRVTAGAVLDAAIDMRKSSPTFGQAQAFELSAANKKMLWIPKGFGHAFLSLEDDTGFMYKCTDLYHVEDEGGIIWNDPKVKIDWGVLAPLVSDKDQKWPRFEESDFYFE
ncbi:MAG TPA: dTDP-4-dehydrorhamnose 3,5-epimerase [Candidatus Bipolaricaulota bacterium]|nr:dTDP-4-dehydrorhamnose 3,5-epimerase [Candidatus Bipolaricaulota bacterium]